LSSTMAEQAEAPDGECVLRAVMSHVRSMLARGFDSSEPDLSPTLRLVVCRLAAMSAQAATLARLACLSRATRKVAAALLPAPTRRAWHASFFALRQIIAVARDAGHIETVEEQAQALYLAGSIAPGEPSPQAAPISQHIDLQGLREAAFQACVLANRLAGPNGLRRYFIRRTWRDEGYNSDGSVVVTRRPPPDDGSGAHIRRCHSR
jgi:hypothetical protein